MSSVVKKIVVETSRERAFRVFTDGIDRWWPREHHIGKSPLARAVIEPHAGGRWYAQSEDGTEVETGRVLVWEPPSRLVMSWQITADWKYDPSFSTEVEVTFVAETPRRTLVTLEHKDIEKFGAKAEEIRKAFEDTGWSGILARFGESALAPKFVLFYDTTPEGLAKARANFPAHRERLDAFRARGTLLMAGNLLEPSARALGIFTTKEAAEEFVAGDPFVINGVVSASTIVAWNEVLF